MKLLSSSFSFIPIYFFCDKIVIQIWNNNAVADAKTELQYLSEEKILESNQDVINKKTHYCTFQILFLA